MDLKVYNYIVKGLDLATEETVERFKSCLLKVKGVVSVDIDAQAQTVKYAIDEWSSEYEVFSMLNEICETFKFDLSFDDDEDLIEEENSQSVECEVIEELQVDESQEDEEEKQVKKGKLTRGDVIEKSIILGISVVLLIIGSILGSTSSARAWILMLSFTVASYETLYDVIIKIAEKKYFVEEIMVFIGALVFMYLGNTVLSAIIMLLYALIRFGIQIITHKNVAEKENYEIALEESKTEEEKSGLKLSLDYLAQKEDEIDAKSAKIVFSQLKYNLIAVVVAILTVFVPPFFTISDYWGVLADKWLYAGATVLLLGAFGEVIFALYNVATSCVLNALNKKVKINGYNAFLNLSKANTIWFDSVGALTEKVGVVESVNSSDENRLGALLVTAYKNNGLPTARAITERFKNVSTLDGVTLTKTSETGVTFEVNSNQVVIGNKRFLKANGIIVSGDYTQGEEIFVYESRKVLGSVKVRFDIKKDSYGAIKELSNDLDLKTAILCGESVERATYLKRELEIDGAVSGANADYKANKVQTEKGVFVGTEAKEDSPLSGLPLAINFGKVGNVCVENDEIRSVPFVIKLSKRAVKTLNFAKIFTLVSKIFLFATTILLSVFTTFEFALTIIAIDFICKAISVANTLRNATSVA